MNKHKKIINWFTLVELIIVVTILAILATIAFVSFKWYSKDSRDANRLTTVSTIKKGLEIYFLKSSKFPEPDIEVLSWSLNWVELNRAWKIWNNISKIIGISEIPTDPKWWNSYLYWISDDNKKYQIWTTLENLQTNNIFISKTYANDQNYKAKVVWNYQYPLKMNGKLRSLPSLLFTWSWWDLSDDNNIKFIINKWSNLPYNPSWILNNTKNTTSLLEEITWTWWLSLTWINIPLLSKNDFESEINLWDLEKLWLSKEELWIVIYWNSYLWSWDTTKVTESTQPIYNSWNTYSLWDIFSYSRWWQSYTFEVVLTTNNWIIAYTNNWNNDINQLSSTDHIWIFWSWSLAWTEIMMSTINAWASSVWSWETFWSTNSPRNSTINSWAWWLYQWWNNADVSYTSTVSWQISCTQVNSTYSNWVFRIWNADWCTTQTNNMWWFWWDDAAKKWPCDNWYRLPSSWYWWDWEKIYQILTWSSDYGCSWCSGSISLFENYLKMSRNGYRLYTNWTMWNQGNYWYYWAYNPDSTWWGYLYMDSSSISPNGRGYRATWHSVRCIKN